MGFNEFFEANRIFSLPKMLGFQAAGAAPLVIGHPVEDPQTAASAIRIGKPARGKEALAAAKESNGFIDSVTDDEILAAYKLIAQKEGYFCEMASAASVAGLIKSVKAGKVKSGATVVCVLTGHGLKDPDTAIEATGEVVKVKPDIKKVEEILFDRA